MILMTTHQMQRNIPRRLNNQGDGNFLFAQQEKIKIQTLLQMLEVEQFFLDKSIHVPPSQSFITFSKAVFVQAQTTIENTKILIPDPISQ